MKKQDLKTGMIVETRSGQLALIVRDNVYGQDAVIFSENNWTTLDGFSEDLRWGVNSLVPKFCKTIDIMKVYKPDLPTGFLSRVNKLGKEKLTLLWERKEEQPIVILDGIEYSESTLRSIIKKALS